jgi:hypothetical protein
MCNRVRDLDDATEVAYLSARRRHGTREKRLLVMTPSRNKYHVIYEYQRELIKAGTHHLVYTGLTAREACRGWLTAFIVTYLPYYKSFELW